MSQAVEPFLGHKRAKNDDKILEAAMTQAQLKKPSNSTKFYIENWEN